jgi:cytochrome c peroxidase
MKKHLSILVLIVPAMCGCSDRATPSSISAREEYAWNLPANFPKPGVPANNPMTEAKVELGRHLFYEPRLSINEKTSCASCHKQELAFTDGKTRAVGTTGQRHPRGAMSLANVVYASRLAWANPHVERLEHQALMPMLGEDPVEMGLNGHEEAVLNKLQNDARYKELFAEAFPEDQNAYTMQRVAQAIACFERTLISGNSAYDRYVRGDQSALSPSAKRGMELFLSERLECFHCHGGFNFSDSVSHSGLPSAEVMFHNNGLYNIDGQGAYPADNTGLHALTGKPQDMGRFKAPTLRNIAVTAPYMHDGSIASLDEVLDHYAAGGRTVSEGPYAGTGAANPLKSEFVPGFIITPEEKADVIAFLNSLTDEEFLTNPRFADPFNNASLEAHSHQARLY